MTKHASRIMITTVGAAGTVLAMSQPAWGAATSSSTATEANLGVDPQALLDQLQRGAKLAAAVAALVIAARLLRGQRRRSWGRAQSELHTGNKLARTPRSLPVMPAGPAEDSMPGWLITGSHTAARRAWSGSTSGSTTGANPVGSMSARTGRPGR